MIVAGIQARMDSRRLPGKALLPLGGRPMIHWTIDRIRQSKVVDDVVLLTTDRSVDDALAEAVREKVRVIRGDTDDVLSRYHCLISSTKADVVLRVTGDCPLVDATLIDNLILLHRREGTDYAHIAAQPEYVLSFPNGVNTEAVTAGAMSKLFAAATTKEDREHVTLPVSRDPTLFTVSRLVPPPTLSRPHYKLSVDTEADLESVSRVVHRLGQSAMTATVSDIVQAMDALCDALR